MLGDGDTNLYRPPSDGGSTAAQVEPSSAGWPPRDPAAGGLAGRILVQGVAMLGVAAIVLAVVDDRSEQTSARLDSLESELSEVRRQRDRMQRLSAALTEELDEATVETEIVRWQLAYTEERLARLRTAAPEAPAHTPPRTLPPRARFVSLDPVGEAPPDAPPVEVSPMLDEAVAVLTMADTATDATPAGAFVPSRLPPSGSGAPSSLLELDSLSGSPTRTRLRPVGSQLERDRAFAVWDSIMDEAVQGECGRRSGAAERRCGDRVRRQLMPWGSRAVECMLSGNAAADYVSDLRLDQLPTHSVPLQDGAVILCDGGLHNPTGLQAPGSSRARSAAYQ